MTSRNLLIVTIGLAILAVLFWKLQSYHSKIKSQGSVITEQTAEIQKIELDNGLIAVQKTRAIADKVELLVAYGWLEDSLASLGVKAKDLESALFIAQKTTGRGTGVIQYDTLFMPTDADTVILVRTLAIREPFFEFDATLFEDDSYKYNYLISDSLAIINVGATRKNLFSPREYNVKAVNANPKNRIVGITSLAIREKPLKNHLVIVAAYGAGSTGLGPFIGIGYGRSLISF